MIALQDLFHQWKDNETTPKQQFMWTDGQQALICASEKSCHTFFNQIEHITLMHCMFFVPLFSFIVAFLLIISL